MIDRDRLMERLKDRLGFKQNPQLLLFDSGREVKTGLRAKPIVKMPSGDRLTVGYGRDLLKKGISQAEAGLLLFNDVVSMELACGKAIPGFEDLPDEEQESIIYTLLVNGGEIDEEAIRSVGTGG